MPTNKLTSVTITDGEVTGGKVEELGLVDRAVGVVTRPMKAFSKSNDYVSETVAAQESLACLGLGFLAGETMGHRRELAGKPAFVFDPKA